MHRIWINDREVATVPSHDRGLMFGDGFFTTMAVYQGQIQCFAQHCQRIAECAHILNIPIPTEFVLSTLQECAIKLDHGGLKLVVTRGSGGQGYQIPDVAEPLWMINAFDLPSRYEKWRQQGITLQTAQTTLASGHLYHQLKTLNRLEQVALKQELAQCSDVDDLIVCNGQGDVIEAIAANVFWRKGFTIYTSDLSDAGVAGTTRNKVLELLGDHPQYDVILGQFGVKELQDADEIFLTNSLMPIVPVSRYENRRFDTFQLTQQLLTLMGF